MKNLVGQVDTAVFRRPTYEKLLALYENYDADVTQREDVTRAEQTEEADFLTEVLRWQKNNNFLKLNLCNIAIERYFLTFSLS